MNTERDESSFERWLEDEPAATPSVDWIEDDLEKTPVGEIVLLDEVRPMSFRVPDRRREIVERWRVR